MSENNLSFPNQKVNVPFVGFTIFISNTNVPLLNACNEEISEVLIELSVTFLIDMILSKKANCWQEMNPMITTHQIGWHAKAEIKLLEE